MCRYRYGLSFWQPVRVWSLQENLCQIRSVIFIGCCFGVGLYVTPESRKAPASEAKINNQMPENSVFSRITEACWLCLWSGRWLRLSLRLAGTGLAAMALAGTELARHTLQVLTQSIQNPAGFSPFFACLRGFIQSLLQGFTLLLQCPNLAGLLL